MTRAIFETIEIPTTHVPFGGASGDFDFVIEGEDLSAATAAAITFAPAQGGTPIAGLTLGLGSGITITYDPAYLDETGAVLGATTLRGALTETQLEALSWGSIPNDEPLMLWADVLITIGGVQDYLCDGPIAITKGIGD